MSALVALVYDEEKERGRLLSDTVTASAVITHTSAGAERTVVGAVGGRGGSSPAGGGTKKVDY